MKGFKEKVLALASFGALVLPWVLRNYALWGVPFFSTVAWVNLAYYNAAALVGSQRGITHRQAAVLIFNETAKREDWPERAKGELDIWMKAEDPRAWRALAETGLRHILADPARYAILHLEGDLGALFPVNPRRVLWLYGLKRGERTGSGPEVLKTLLQKGPLAALEKVVGGLPWWAKAFVLYAIVYQLGLYGLAALGFWRRRRERWAWLAAALALVFVLVPGPLAAPRHRYPADVLLSALGGVGFVGKAN